MTPGRLLHSALSLCSCCDGMRGEHAKRGQVGRQKEVYLTMCIGLVALLPSGVEDWMPMLLYGVEGAAAAADCVWVIRCSWSLGQLGEPECCFCKLVVIGALCQVPSKGHRESLTDTQNK